MTDYEIRSGLEPEFDRTWMGPDEMKPRAYRSQLEKDTWYSVVVDNEYNLGDLAPADVVIDIGAHIGSFSWLAHHRGSRRVFAYEPNKWHLEAAHANLDDLDGVILTPYAVVRSDAAKQTEYRYATATWTIIRGPEHPTWDAISDDAYRVGAWSLDQIIDAVGPVRFLKIDVEGSEWPILYTCTKLDQVAEIAGEYHPKDAAEGAELAGLPPCRIDALMTFLGEQGFVVAGYKPDSADDWSLGKFWARR